MSKSTQKRIGAFAVAAAIGVAAVAPMPAQARSAPQQIERFGNKWAPAFAAGSKKHMGQPALQQMIGCKVPGVKIRNCTPLSSAYRKSFKDARVQDIAIKYSPSQAGVNFGSAAVKFSNGKAVELVFQGAAAGGAKFNATIAKIGGNAGRRFFK